MWIILGRVISGGCVVKNPPASVGDAGLIPGSGRSPGEGNGNLLQYSCLKNFMERGAWWATVQGVAKSQTRLSTCTHILWLKIMKAPKRKSYHHKYLHTTGQLWWEDQDLLCVPLPLPGPANICLPNVCSSISISIAFFSFEDPDHYPQHAPVSLAEDSV